MPKLSGFFALRFLTCYIFRETKAAGEGDLFKAPLHYRSRVRYALEQLRILLFVLRVYRAGHYRLSAEGIDKPKSESR